MTRAARQAALGTILVLISCSVYDTSLLVGVTESSGTAAHGNGGNGGGLGGSGPSGGSKSGSSGKGSGASTSGGSSGSSGGSDPSGGSGASGGSSNGGSSNGGSSNGGSSNGGSSNGGTTGGTDTSPGGMGEGGDAGADSAGDGGTTSAGNGGTAGTGGSGAGSGGTTGGAGAGAAGSGGNAGSAAGMGGSAGSATTASGCAVLSAGLAADTDKTHYVITLGSSDVDLTSAVVSVHLYAKGTGGGLFLYLQQATYEFYSPPSRAFSGIDGWTTLTWDLSAASTSPVDKAKVRRLGIEINGIGATSWTSPMLVYLDSITVTTPALSFPFDVTATVHTAATSLYTADTALWLNNSSSDTTATGSTVAWAASCP